MKKFSDDPISVGGGRQQEFVAIWIYSQKVMLLILIECKFYAQNASMNEFHRLWTVHFIIRYGRALTLLGLYKLHTVEENKNQ